MNPMNPKLSLRRLALPALAVLGALLSGCASTGLPAAQQPGSPVAEPPVQLSSARTSQPSAATKPATTSAALAAALPQVEDSLQPGVPVDLNDSSARADLWQRVRAGFAMPDLDNALVGKAEQWYSSRPDYVQRMTERGSRYLYHIVVEVEKRGMPTELALLPFIESAFNPQALSSAKASGIWQFMPATGRDFDLKQNIFRDDRRDVLASTRAALDYLGQLYGMFGDWHLALAAYNWGQGNVQRAIRRNLQAGKPTDYESLRMPDETRYYVPKLQAVKNIVLRPEAFSLALAPVANHPYFLSVNIDRDIDVDLAARLAGMSEAEFKQFNPQVNKPVLLAASTPQLLLPWDNAEAFSRALAAHQGPMASWTAWVLPRTMTPADAAAKVGMSEAALREVNKIPPRMLVGQGSTLLVPRSARHDSDVSEHLADTASIKLTPAVQLRRVTVKARKGETLAALAQRQKVSVEQLLQWNELGAKASLKAGQTLVVFTPVQAKTRVAAASPAKRSSVARAAPARKVAAARSASSQQKPSRR